MEKDPGVASELDELAALGLITRPARTRRRSYEDQDDAPLSYGESDVAEPELTALGRRLHDLLELERISTDDILATIADGGDYRRRHQDRPMRPSQRRT
jgi:hypothetical protein